jgi:ankyrin repeat protein
MTDLKSFQEYVKKGDLSAVKAAVAEDPLLADTANEAGQTAYLLAKYYRQEKMAAFLLEFRPDLDFFEACVAGQTRVVMSEIQENGGLLQAHNTDGWTPLHLAAFFGHPELAQALLDQGAQVDARSTNAMKNTPLHAAAAGGKTDLVQVLLQRGADVHARQEGGWTALHAAAQAGNRSMVEVLIAGGADLQAHAANNQSPLDLALLKGHGEIVALLEELGGSSGRCW